MVIDLKIYFLLFIIYSCLGWAMEVAANLIESKKFVNRGFLIGPYCPIYGYGATLITFLLKKYMDDPIALFVMAIVVCGILEYLTSYLMEKIFKARWWDYSKKRFNINGRICLDTIVIFGLLGLLIMYVTNPFFIKALNKLTDNWLNILFWSLLILFVTDNIASTVITSYIRKTLKLMGSDLDNTEELTKQIKQILREKSILHRRLVNAYPSLEAVKLKIKEKKEEIEKQVKEQKREIEKKIEEQTKKIEKNVEETTKKIEEKAKRYIRKKK